MYIPSAFEEHDLATLHDFIEANSFGLLISQVEGRPFATHVPFLLDRTATKKGTLVGHFARVNPQWKEMTMANTLAVFSGPHAYISPTWYQAENMVPTWNYMAVHVTGRVSIMEDEERMLDIVARSTEVYERAMPQPWKLDRSANYVKKLLSLIVGFEIEIMSIEGKFKLNQNHPVARRLNVAKELHAQGTDEARGIAAAMEKTCIDQRQVR
jgi:transcriptional regulator